MINTALPDTPAYAELAAASNFSFLRGASHPGDMVMRAVELGLTGIGIADRNSVAGVVRAHVALKKAREEIIEQAEEEGVPLDEKLLVRLERFRLVVGARLCFLDETPDIIAYPANRHGWGRLTRLLTLGNLRAKKGACHLHLPDLVAHIDDLLLIVVGEIEPEVLGKLSKAAPKRIWLGAVMNRQGRDDRQLLARQDLAEQNGVPLVAINDAVYAGPEARPLHDVLTAIRIGKTVAEAGRELAANAERHIKSPQEMRRLFAAAPDAIAETQHLMSCINFRLDQLRYEYPTEPVPHGWNAQEWLEHMVMEAAHKRYGAHIPAKAQALIDEEFTLIRSEEYANYFLTVHDIVRYAQGQGILCQGRGSAANSIVCFLLGVTSVDPMEHDLLFSRFMSTERKEPPDIDVDFEHERREEVMQYIYRRYGRDHAGIASTIIHFRPRSAVREVGKALGLTEDITQRLSSTVWGSYSSDHAQNRVEEAGLDPDNPEIARLGHFTQQILNFPRHLSQHVGGFVLTRGRLDEMVPIHNAAMDDRTFIEWDKDDIEALGLMKVDILALGMLTAIAKGFTMMKRHGLGQHSLEVDIKSDDRVVYDMLCTGDSVGVFQIESRAQINMLPRLRPRCFYDLVIQVAIVRPGPIEGDMVHPFLRRRNGEERIDLPSPNLPHPPDELRNVLGKTLGVPIFQEQAMKLAIVAANFSSADANRLRRAMATFRNLGTIKKFREKMVGGMAERGYQREFAERCFKQIEGFGSYGFPESHAQSFARLVYVSAWIKCHHPAVFAACLLNSQPMGFYAPAQLVRDAQQHGVDVRPIDVNFSHWDNGLEDCEGKHPHALRLGYRQITGFREEWGQRIAAGRTPSSSEAVGQTKQNRFASMEQIARQCGLPSRALQLLADADCFTSIGLNRRKALWEVRRIPDNDLPLFAAAGAPELADEPEVNLRTMAMGEEVATDYQITRLSLKNHPMALMRPLFDADNVTPCSRLRSMKDGARVRVAGVVLTRQRPGKGKAVFITLEDEGGIANIVLWENRLERYRRAVMASRVMMVDGQLQISKEGVIHVMAVRIIDVSDRLGHLPDIEQAGQMPDLSQGPSYPIAPVTRSGHPRNVRLLPKSRDFH